jgi:hypothetical protein
MLSLMKRQIPKEAWGSSFVTFDDAGAIRKDLDMKNRLVSRWQGYAPSCVRSLTAPPPLPQVSYVFLVDQEGRIRWKGVGYAQHHEMKSLLECAAQLTRLR